MTENLSLTKIDPSESNSIPETKEINVTIETTDLLSKISSKETDQTTEDKNNMSNDKKEIIKRNNLSHLIHKSLKLRPKNKDKKESSTTESLSEIWYLMSAKIICANYSHPLAKSSIFTSLKTPIKREAEDLHLLNLGTETMLLKPLRT